MFKTSIFLTNYKELDNVSKVCMFPGSLALYYWSK